MIPGCLADAATALMRRMDAETAHGLAIRALATGLGPAGPRASHPGLLTRVFDLDFPNPLGMAAGFDKNAEVPDALLALGFGFVEVGTLTPRPQAGNPRPRIFRIPEAGAVVNRLGFNNAGHDPAHARLAARRHRGGIVGVNVGANKDSDDRPGDYVEGIRRFADLASYFTVNISSPNTPGLRDLQAKAALDDLAARVIAARDAHAGPNGRRVPVLLKIAPDLDEAGLDDVAEVVLTRRLDGLIVSNTTLSRQGVGGPAAAEPGGLSGPPLFSRSTAVLARMRQRVGPALPIIGVGGVRDAAGVADKIAAGANLVQLYTGLVYGGPGLPARILAELPAVLAARGAATPAALQGTMTGAFAARPLDG